MLSVLSRGYSSWTGELDVFGDGPEKTRLPAMGPVNQARHLHGVTVTPRTPTRGLPHLSYPQPVHPAKDDGCLELPKTYLTRKGALLLYSSLDDPQELKARLPCKRKKQNLLDLTLKLGTLERLSLSVLQYGDQGFDRENSSISDKENRWFLKFLRQMTPLDHELSDAGSDSLTDQRAQPGADLEFYLQDLKQRASLRHFGQERAPSSRARSRELQELLQHLEEAWHSGQDHAHPQANGSHLGTEEFFYTKSLSFCSDSSRVISGGSKVLSSHKLTASLKSLHCLAQNPSTDPREQLQNVATPVALFPGHPAYVQNSWSAFWNQKTDASELHKRPLSSHSSFQQPCDTERRLVVTPNGVGPEERSLDAADEEGQDERDSFKSRAISVEFSPPYGIHHKSSSRLRTENAEADQASISSSIQQENGVPLTAADVLPDFSPSKINLKGTEEDEKSMEWTDLEDVKMMEEEEIGKSLAKPLQPQYSGNLQDIDDVYRSCESEKPYLTEQDSKRSSRSGSGVSMRSKDIIQPSSLMSSRRVSLTEQKAEAEERFWDDLMTANNSDQQKDANLPDLASQLLLKEEEYASSFSGSVDQSEADPRIFVSVQLEERTETASVSKLNSYEQTEAFRRKQDSPEFTVISSTPASELKIDYTAFAPESERTVFVSMPTEEPLEDEPQSEQDKEQIIKLMEATGTVKDTVCIPIEAAEDEKTSNDPDYMAVVMAEAGFKTIPSPYPPFASASSHPPSSIASSDIAVKLQPPEQDHGTDRASQMAKQVLSKVMHKASEKASVVKKAEVRVSQQPSKKTQTSSKQKLPAKGGKVEKKSSSSKTFIKAMDIASLKPDHPEDASTLVTQENLKKKLETYRPPPPPPHVKTSTQPVLVIPEHMKDAMARSISLSELELENEFVKIQNVMEESLGLPTLVTNDSEGLTEEELQEAEQALKDRLEETQRKMQEAGMPESERLKPSSLQWKEPDLKGKKSKKMRTEDPKAMEQKARREAAREQKHLEQQKRLEHARALEEMIKQKEFERKEREVEATRKAKELQEQMEQIRAEEDVIQQAEEDAREQLAALRKIQREEREMRRKADLERKKQRAQARREKERQMMEAARRKELEMLERIADSEMQRAIREEEERKRDEEERLAQERFEEELQEAELQADEDERRLQELERQAEEEAFQRIIAEREEAEKQRQELERQARKMEEEEEELRQALLEEEKRLAEEKRRQEAEEERRLEEEKERLRELQRLEEEARSKMREEMERCRESARKRREVNINRMRHLTSLQHSQAISEPYIFSYFVHWPRETYMRRMGTAANEQKKPAKKK